MSEASVVADQDAPADDPGGLVIEQDTLVLPKDCKLPVAEELKDVLLAHPDDSPLVLDAGAVEKFGSACVLTVASLIQTRSEASAKTSVKAAPPALIDAFRDLGLFQELMKMEFCE